MPFPRVAYYALRIIYFHSFNHHLNTPNTISPNISQFTQVRMFLIRKNIYQEDVLFCAVICVAIGGLVVFAIVPELGWINGIPPGGLTAFMSFLVLIQIYNVFEMRRVIKGLRIREMEAAKSSGKGRRNQVFS